MPDDVYEGRDGWLVVFKRRGLDQLMVRLELWTWSGELVCKVVKVE